MIGIAAATYYRFDLNLTWAMLGALGIMSILRIKSRLGYIVLFALGLLAGLAYMSWHISTRPTHTIDDYQFRKIDLSGEVYGDPYWDEDRNHVFYLRDLHVGGKPVAGEVRIKSLIGNAKEGYRVRLSGKNWPIMGKTHNQISYAKPAIVSTDRTFLQRLKSGFVDGVHRALPEPAASFMVGILIGARSNLPKYFQDNLNNIGLSHMVAVSGYNLTILTVILARLLGKRWRWASLVFSCWVIMAFVVLTGMSPSILRAGIMAGFFLLASHSGRQLAVEVCLALGVLVTLIINPTYLLGDLSWQLSFLSLAGIVLLAPKIKSSLPGRGKLNYVSEVIAVTLAAQIATMPLIVYTFGRISLIAPLANLLVMPLVPLLMLAGFVAGVAGMLMPNLAYVAMSPIRWLVDVLIIGLNTMASYKWSAATISKISIANTALAYGLIMFFALLRSPRELQNEAKMRYNSKNNTSGETGATNLKSDGVSQ